MITDLDTVPPIKEVQTRFLYSFFFRHGALSEARDAMLRANVPSRSKGVIPIWECTAAHELYKEEVLGHVVKFLFSPGTNIGCEYLRLNEALGNRWFNKTEVELLDLSQFRVRLVPRALIEVFLSSYGVGILSITLRPETHRGFRPWQVIDFNYRLSQFRANTAAHLITPHPAADADGRAPLSESQQHQVRVVSDGQSSVFERIGRPGGRVRLSELATELVSPLGPLSFKADRHQFGVYTVVRFGPSIDFSDPKIKHSLSSFLSALAQVEEPRHAGSGEGITSIGNVVLNRKHWFGAGLLGAAHLVADQVPSDHPFNSARMPRIVIKYFTPYLAALIQRVVLQRASEQASEIVLSPGGEVKERFDDLRTHLLEFALEGSFAEVTHRDTIHRYYRLSRDMLNVPAALAEIRQAVADIDARNTSSRQVQIAEDLRTNAEAAKTMQMRMAQNMSVIAKVQTMVEWIEIIVVSVYVAHLWDLFASHIPSLEHWVSLGVAIAAALGAVLALVILKPWRHKRHSAVELEP